MKINSSLWIKSWYYIFGVVLKRNVCIFIYLFFEYKTMRVLCLIWKLREAPRNRFEASVQIVSKHKAMQSTEKIIVNKRKICYAMSKTVRGMFRVRKTVLWVYFYLVINNDITQRLRLCHTTWTSLSNVIKKSSEASKTRT